jgi:hypothetical protein
MRNALKCINHILSVHTLHPPATDTRLLLLLSLLPQGFFADEKSKGRTYRELYELVQHAGNVLPRL